MKRFSFPQTSDPKLQILLTKTQLIISFSGKGVFNWTCFCNILFWLIVFHHFFVPHSVSLLQWAQINSPPKFFRLLLPTSLLITILYTALLSKLIRPPDSNKRFGYTFHARLDEPSWFVRVGASSGRSNIVFWLPVKKTKTNRNCFFHFDLRVTCCTFFWCLIVFVSKQESFVGPFQLQSPVSCGYASTSSSPLNSCLGVLAWS